MENRLATWVVGIGIFLGLLGFGVEFINHKSILKTTIKLTEVTNREILPVPKITAKHVLIKDLNNGEILYNLRADEPAAPASTTKMMTALVAAADYGFEKEIVVGKSFKEGSVAGFKAGEKYTVEQLIYSLLLKSANDAAEILAATHPGGRNGFIMDMNKKASEMGLTTTVFKNPSGLDEEGHMSSATDLARLGEYLIKKPDFAKIVATETVAIINNETRSGELIANTNPLLGKVPGVLGIKTGYTDNAGEALISLVDRDGKRVIVVVLGSEDRKSDSEKLIEWTYKNFTLK